MRCLVVLDSAKDKPIIFSSFQPDAAQSIWKLQTTYPVSRVNKLFTLDLVLISFEGPIQLDSVQYGYHVMRCDL
ncbi:hypothetical protein LguiA_029988 [Lonicera macranthoides]